jgi:hypothetical protein
MSSIAAIDREEVRIVLRNGNKLLRKKVYCMSCGGYLFSYFDEMSIIIDGHSEPQQRQIEITCFRCKVVYQIC